MSICGIHCGTQEASSECNFGAYLEDALRDHLVCEISNENIQRGLLVALLMAVKHAIVMESAQSIEGRPPANGGEDRYTSKSACPLGTPSVIVVETRLMKQATSISKLYLPSLWEAGPH